VIVVVLSVPSQVIGWEERLRNHKFLYRMGRKILAQYTKKCVPVRLVSREPV